MKLKFYGQIFENNEIRKNENLSSRGRVVPRGRTDGQTHRHDDANSRLQQCCEGKKYEFTRLGAFMIYVARCEIILNKPENVSTSFILNI
jgi:hypothetical protein